MRRIKRWILRHSSTMTAEQVSLLCVKSLLFGAVSFCVVHVVVQVVSNMFSKALYVLKFLINIH